MSLDARFEVRVNAAGFPVVVRKGEIWPEPAAAAEPAKGGWRMTDTQREETKTEGENGRTSNGLAMPHKRYTSHLAISDYLVWFRRAKRSR